MPPDRGAQVERTALAWQRTGLLGLFVGALLIRQAALDGGMAVPVAAMGLAFGASVWGVGRHHDSAATTAQWGSNRARAIRGAAFAAVALGLGVCLTLLA